MTSRPGKEFEAVRSNRELLAMVGIARTILRHTELDDILAAITRELVQVITFDRSSVALMAPDGQALTLQHIFKGDATAAKVGEGRRIPVNDNSVIGWVAQTRRPVLREDIMADGRFLEVVKEEQLRSDMIVPLVARDRVIGTINVGCYRPGALCEHDLEMLVSLSEIASGAVEYALLLQEARDLSERHQLLRRNARDIIMLVDRNTGAIIEVNRKACEALGYSEQEMLEKTYFDLFTEEDRFQAKRDFVNILSQRTRQFVDRRFVACDGTTIHIDISADVMTIQQDTFVQVVVHDISQRRMLEQQVIAQNKNLQEANRKLTEVDRMKTEFLQNISHELRTPLSVIIAYTDSLRDETLSHESRKDFLDIVAENGNNLLKLINDLIDLSRLEISDAMLSLSLSHVHDVIRAMWPVLDVEAKRKDIEMRFQPGFEVPPTHMDSKRIQQVLECLIQNAIKFTERGGVVSVRTERSGDEVWVSVSDTGAGIPAADIDRIFDAFRQIDGSATRRWGGLGIGLAMARHVIELHDGRIWVESEEDTGSTFTFALPERRRGADSGPVSLVVDSLVEDRNGTPERR
jgi:PAS domain S-box-containing protein